MTDKHIFAALHGAMAALPHLSGLAHLVTISADGRVATAAITQSGRMLVNADWFAALTFSERTFVVAHELMHLALRSHERCSGEDARLFNVAHDLIINDMLSKALDMPVPADGLHQPGASASSAERIVTQLKRDRAASGEAPHPVWRRRDRRGPGENLGGLGAALLAAGLGSDAAPAPPAPDREGDVLDAEAERRLFPDLKPDPAAIARIAAAGERAAALGVWLERTRTAFDAADAAAPADGGRIEGLFDVLSNYHAPPWEVALQHWFDAVAPSGRTYSRCSRRQGDRADVVLSGRRREGWTLNVVLDTSGSMFWGDGDSSPISRALGSLKSFCVAADVGRVRIVQADVAVEADDIVDPRDLDRFPIAGGGGSDMAPSMRMLAADPDVEAAIVITDGAIAYPDERMPYDVLWALTDKAVPDEFQPDYGRIVLLDLDSAHDRAR